MPHENDSRLSLRGDGGDGTNDRQILALRALSGMLAACDSTPIKLSELTYLLDPIIDKQEALVDELMNAKNVVHLSKSPGKAPPLSLADNL